MNERTQKWMRLTGLRQRQHEMSVLGLREAQAALQVQEDALETLRQAERQVHLRRSDLSHVPTATDWLLSCADTELCLMQIDRLCATRERAVAGVADAAQREQTARRERKQMETTLETAQRTTLAEAAKVEQQQMEEASRVLSGFSSNPVSLRKIT